MRARAPGKLVLSGAYAVLRGAPAVVSAVDRFVVADASRISDFETPELAAWLTSTGRPARHPAFDASALRDDGKKLGLGSSAAILVASALALLGEMPSAATEQAALLETLRDAHRRAQGGGSGIDVAAAFHGGTRRAVIDGATLGLAPAPLPRDLVLEVWALGHPASTSEFVARVFACESSGPREFGARLGAQTEAAELAARALEQGRTSDFVAALRLQFVALGALGEMAGVPIVVPAARRLAEQLDADACFLPAGAGGGDVSLYVGTRPSGAEFGIEAARHGLSRVSLSFEAAGVSLLDGSPA